MDASKEVTIGQLQAQKDFVKKITNKMQVTSQGPRAAVLAFSDIPLTLVDMGRHSTLEDFHSKVDQARNLGGIRRVATALETAANKFTAKGKPGHRVVLLLTTGNSSDTVDRLRQAKKSLQNIGARTYVIVISSKPATTNFMPVVDSYKRIFVASADFLSHLLYPLARHISETKGNLPIL